MVTRNLKNIVKVTSLIFIFLLLVIITSPPDTNISMGTPSNTSTSTVPTIAYIYRYDLDDANSYKSLLESKGFGTDLIDQSTITSGMFSDYRIILVGSDTGSWGDDPKKLAAMNNSLKPIIGLGAGGALFFQQLPELYINYIHTWYGNDEYIEIVDSSHPIFNRANVIGSGNIKLYESTREIGVYLPTIPDDIVVLGRESNDTNQNHYSIVQEQSRYLLWGFYASPTNMTQTGKDLFTNIVHYFYGPRVAYIDRWDVSTSDSYRSFLEHNGFITDLINITDVTAGIFTEYDVILMGPDSGWLGIWGDAAKVAAVNNSGKPIIGLGAGGASYFQQLPDLDITWGHSWYAINANNITIMDSADSVFNRPNVIGSGTIQVTTSSNCVAIYLPTIPADVVVLGRQANDPNHYSIAQQQTRYLLWGFEESPVSMTQTGKDLFINTVVNMIELTKPELYIDQVQEDFNYGFWFEADVIHWQEFRPRLTSLAQIDLYIRKTGNPGNLRVAINDSNNRLRETTILESDVRDGSNWITIPIVPILPLIPGDSYFIYVWSDANSPDTDNRYVWRGNITSTYDRGITSVEEGYPSYDFTFRTWTINYYPDMCLDQVQEENDYSFWFEETVIRWQEFKPFYTSLAQIDLYIDKRGKPLGNLTVAIDNATDRLWESTVLEADVPNGINWITIPVVPTLPLIPGDSYFIYVGSDGPSDGTTNRYFWRGKTDSMYDRGNTSVETGWTGYDFTFRTWSINCFTDVCLDQAQEENNYGFWFDETFINWQEFKPFYTSLAQIDLYIDKTGDPLGNLTVAIGNATGRLWETTVLENDVPNGINWITIPVVPTLPLIPGDSYFIYVGSDGPSNEPTNRYFWRGKTGSAYDRGNTSLEDSWPGYDFTFRVWSLGCRITPLITPPTTHSSTTTPTTTTNTTTTTQTMTTSRLTTTESSEETTPGVTPGWTLLLVIATIMAIIPIRSLKRRSK